MFQGFKKATPYGGARKLRLTQPPVRRSYVSYPKEAREQLFSAVSHVCAIEVFTYQDLSIIQIGSTPCFQLKPFY